jgi:hypothetical protein
MDTNLLCTWLNLPPGRWPPDDRTLLSLPPGPINPADAERRALMLMGKLRPHQLLHPELVTEGMNRLAQSMLSLTTQRTSTAIPRATTSSPVPTVVSIKPAVPIVPVYDVVELDPLALETPTIALPEFVRPQPVILDAEIVEDEPEPTGPAVRFLQTDEPDDAPDQRAFSQPTISIPEVEVPVLELPPGLSGESRRLVYRRLAALRALQAAWLALRPYCGNPSNRIDTPGRVWGLLEAAEEFQRATNHKGFDAEEFPLLAPKMFAVFGPSQVLPILRMLSYQQRLALAHDWATGQAKLEALHQAMRNSLFATRPRGTLRQKWRTLTAHLSQNPEWFLAPAGGLIVLATLFKFLAHST